MVTCESCCLPHVRLKRLLGDAVVAFLLSTKFRIYVITSGPQREGVQQVSVDRTPTAYPEILIGFRSWNIAVGRGTRSMLSVKPTRGPKPEATRGAKDCTDKTLVARLAAKGGN